MKKLFCLCIAFALLLSGSALAESTAATASVSTANAVAESVNTYDLTAPFSGVVQPFTWRRGDKVLAKDVLFTLDTVKIYAPETGTLQGVFVSEGDLCEAAIAQYGMIAAIEKTKPFVVVCNTKGAYDSTENKIIHLGDTLYIEETKDTDNDGEGRVIAVSGDDFTLELTAGEFDPADGVKIYRDEKMGTKTCVGLGSIARAADVPVTGSGRVLKSYYRQGQQVRKGQLLFELAPSDAEASVTSAEVTAAYDGALSAPLVVSGQQVYKGQTLITVHDLSSMQVVAEVDEMDLDKVHVGDSLNLVFDRYPDTEIAGAVRSIAQMGQEKQNATYYNVEISFTTSLEVLPGMNATVYLPASK
ncbi:MAG: efflux RND transporter periplasmic adaptor subunit [Eubacteriales bacterium]|nr:efflux RND transporter periplasmic adaptor subunit [Eubacteriales bacterium]